MGREISVAVKEGGSADPNVNSKLKDAIAKAKAANVPVVNYGMAIAHMHGILKRSLQVFPDAAQLLGE